MDDIRAYFLSVTGAAIICGILNSLLGKNTGAGKLLRLICGIFLTVVIIRPITQLDIDAVTDFRIGGTDEVSLAVEAGENLASDAMAEIIKTNCEAYILDKAQSLGLALSVEVEVTQGELPVPQTVYIHGSASPYARSQLIAILKEQLGIAEEDQIWTG